MVVPYLEADILFLLFLTKLKSNLDAPVESHIQRYWAFVKKQKKKS